MNIVLIGSGNIATHLGKAIAQLETHHIVQVYSYTLANAQALANVLSTQAIDDLRQLDKQADLYLLAVSDSAISSVVAQLPKDLTGTVVHCSGATDIHVLDGLAHTGVIYPVQSFSKELELDLRQVPFGLEASSPADFNKLQSLIESISTESFPCSSAQRLAIHVSAVFANNFSNALFQVAYDLLKAHDLPFDLLRPIILETARKVQNHEPKDVQTGPAIRKDEITMQKHLQFISGNPDWQLIYQQISTLITKRKAKKDEY